MKSIESKATYPVNETKEIKDFMTDFSPIVFVFKSD